MRLEVGRRYPIKKPETCEYTNKKTLSQTFSCEFCEISNNTFFYVTLLVAASVNGHVKNKLKSL